MKKDMSEESFSDVKDAANAILDKKGKTPPYSNTTELNNGDLRLMREHDEVWIIYQGNEVFHAYPASKIDPPFVFFPSDWIDELNRLL